MTLIECVHDNIRIDAQGRWFCKECHTQLPDDAIDQREAALLSLLGAQSRRPPPMVHDVLAIDGPARAYFQIPLEASPDENGERPCLLIKYHSVVLRAATPQDCWRIASAHMRLIWEAMERLCPQGGIIWWRQHWTVPEPDPTASGQPQFRVKARLGTSPALPDTFWKAFGPANGE